MLEARRSAHYPAFFRARVPSEKEKERRGSAGFSLRLARRSLLHRAHCLVKVAVEAANDGGKKKKGEKKAIHACRPDR